MSEFQDAQREFQAQRKAQTVADADLLEGGIRIPDGGAIPRGGEQQPGLISRAIEFATGTQRFERLPPEIQERPEVIQALLTSEFEGVPVDTQRRIAEGLLVSMEPQNQIETLRTALPEIQDADIQTNPDGVTTIRIRGKNFLLNRPGLSGQDRAQALATITAFLPSAGIASLAKSTVGKILVGGVSAGLTSLGLDVAAEARGAQEAISPERAAVSALTGGAAEFVGPALATRARGRIAQRAGLDEGTTAARRAVIEQNVADLEQAGIRGTPGQISESPRALFAQERIAQTEEGSLAASEFFRGQIDDAFQSVDELSESIAPGAVAATAPARARQAIELRRDALKQARAEVTSPLYENAFTAGARVDTSGVVARLNQVVDEEIVSGPIHDALSAVRDDIAKAAQVRAASGAAGGSNIKALHNVRRTINERIAKQGEGGLGPQAKAELLEARQQLTQAMEEQSDFYRVARGRFIAESPELNAFDESILAKARRVRPENVEQVRTIAFKDVASMEKAKSAINKADPSGETWNALLRSEMDNRVRALDVPALAGEAAGPVGVGNTPTQIRNALFGKGQKKRILMEAMTPEQRSNAMALDNSLRLAGLGRKVGSPTQPAQEFRRSLEGIPRSVAEWLTSPLSRAREIGSEAVFRRNAKVLSELIFNDKFSAETTRIRVMRATPTAKRRAMTQLLNRVGKDVAPEQEEGAQERTLVR